MIRLVVFDLDGTLVDSAAQIIAAMRAGYAAAGQTPPSDAEILGIIGISLKRAVERLSPGMDPQVRDTIVAAYRDTFFADAVVPPLYHGVRQTLEGLSARPGMKLAVATGKARRGLLKVLGQHGLGHVFHSLHGGDEYPSKPDPAMLQGAMAAAEVAPDETAMVGDSVFDMEMARSAGASAIAVTWGYGTPAALLAAGAGKVISSFGDLSGAIPRRPMESL